MNTTHPSSDLSLLDMRFAAIPLHERVLDELAELLIHADLVLGILQAEDPGNVRWVEPHIQKVFDEINDVMRRLCD